MEFSSLIPFLILLFITYRVARKSEKAQKDIKNQKSVGDELKKLKDLLDEGVLSDEEFQKEKNKILNEDNITDIKNSVASEAIKNVSSSKSTNEEKSEEGWSRKTYVLVIVAVGLLMIIVSTFDSSPTSSPSLSNISNNTSSSSGSSQCNIWVDRTSKNANQIGVVLDGINDELVAFNSGQKSFKEIEPTLNNYLSKLKTIESSQKNLTPNASNESSHTWFLRGIDNYISGIGYVSSGLKNDYTPTLDGGLELLSMGTKNIERATDRLVSC